MTIITQVAQAIQEVLTETAEQAGRASGFVQRASKLGGATFSQTLVFGWMDNPEASLDELTQTAAQCGVTITPQGLDQRFTLEAAACLRQVLEAAVERVVRSAPAALPLLERFTGVYLYDSTGLALPDELKAIWQGCGGRAPSGAALKLQGGSCAAGSWRDRSCITAMRTIRGPRCSRCRSRPGRCGWPT